MMGHARKKLLSLCFCLVNIFEEYESKSLTVSFHYHVPETRTKILLCLFFTQNCHKWLNKRAVGPVNRHALK